MRTPTMLALATLSCATPLNAQSQRPAAARLLTRPERTAFRETSRYDDVMEFLRALPRSPRIHLTTMGYSGEGRSLPLVVVGTVADGSPEAVMGSGKLRVYVQANIHAGEVEGKEALQMLLRDLAAGRHARWLDSLVLLIAPIYNADGNERVSLTNRPLQFGPIGGQGQRANAAGLDLNRDHMKLETAEARSQVLMLRRYDPHVAMDLHTTDGSVHGYHLTYGEPLHPAIDSSIRQLMRRDWLPEVARRIKAGDGWDLYFYGNFPDSPVDRGSGGTELGWYSFDARPRFSQSYWGIRNRIGILSEAYSYAGFEERIRVTLRFVEECVGYAFANAGLVRRLTAAADARRVIGDSLPLRARLKRGPDVAILRGEVADTIHPHTGQRMLRRLDVRRPEPMPDYTTFEGAEFERVPRAYYVPAALRAVVERLSAHGIVTGRLEQTQVMPLERYRIDSTWTAAREFQGHRERQVRGAWEAAQDSVPAGTVVVTMDQPLARLIFMLLEPRSDDGLLNWNAMDDAVTGARYYPVRRTF